MSPRSLRTTFLGGTLLIIVPIVVGLAGVVYLRARATAEAALHDALRVRAGTLASVLEIEDGAVVLDLPPGERPEYFEPGSGVYFVLYAPDGSELTRSPSLEKSSLPKPTLPEGAPIAYRRCEAGPFDAPCEIAETRYGVFIEDGDDDDDHAAPAGVDRDARFLMQMALDRRETDRSLASLATFLALAGLLGIAAALGGAAVLSHLLLAPIHRMTEAARLMSPEAPGRRLEPSTVVRELHSLATTLNAAFDGLTGALRRQERLTADASHELRTPVTVLLSNAELLLRRERTGDEYREGLARQLRVARRMSQIVRDLLFLARLDSGHQPIERAPVDLAEVAASACDEWQAIAAKSEITLEHAATGSAVVVGDAARLHQLTDNLLSNALKFTPRAGRVRVDVARENGSAVLRVADSGRGIAPENHARLFERFFRVDEKPHEPDGDSSGSGLGLAIVDGIARAHGGEVDVESRLGVGTVFTLRLPAAPAEIIAAAE